MDTFHGFREKHIDAYLNEFVFLWNLRRSFRTTMDRILGIGQSLPRTTYRDIIGDTSEWRKKHAKQIREMVSPVRLKLAKALAREMRITIIEAIHEIGPQTGKKYKRRQPRRPVLAPRREGEKRTTARYNHPPRRTCEEIRGGCLRMVGVVPAICPGLIQPGI